MPSGQDFANRLLEEARRTLAPHVHSLQEEITALQKQVTGSAEQLQNKLLALNEFELPSADSIIAGAMADAVAEAVADSVPRAVGEAVRRKDEEKLRLANFATTMRKAETQEEILTLLLDGAAQFASKTVLFVPRSDQFIGWSSRGCPDSVAARINSEPFSLSDSPALTKALEVEEAVPVSELADEPVIAKMLDGDNDGSSHALALRAMRRPVALLLAAAGQGGSCDLDALRLMLDITGLCIENVALKILQELKASTPAARGGKVTSPAAAVKDMPQHQEKSPHAVEAAVLTTQPGTAEAQLEIQALSLPGGPLAESPAVVAEMPSPAAQSDDALATEVSGSGTTGAVPESHAEAQPPIAAAPVVAVEAPTAVNGEKPVSSGSAPFVPRDVALPRLTDEERLHSDAKRFARLLVSEIKLYNEQRVAEGRTHRDLYVRLKRDIDRSREMYEKRVSSAVSHKVDYFHDEVIRILAENDPTTLGSDYPGPSI